MSRRPASEADDARYLWHQPDYSVKIEGSGRAVAITQARMGSTRLPGKSLRRMQGRPMLQLMMERLHSGGEDVLHVVATSTDPSDDPIQELCEELNVPCERGPLEDVLQRYVEVLDRYDPAVALRLTGDNPLLDADAVRGGLEAYEEISGRKDSVGVCNHLEDRTDPLGYCVEVFEPDALRRLAGVVNTDEEREHVTLGFKRKGLYRGFRLLSGDQRDMRWTVDTEEDFAYVERLFSALGRDVMAREAVRWCSDHPHPGNLDSGGYYR